MSVKLLHYIYAMEERFIKQMKENRGYLRAVAGMIVIALFFDYYRQQL